MTRPVVAAHGLSVSPPAGWEATIYRRAAAPGEQTAAVMHAATVALPPERGDYGAGVVEALGPADVFVGLLDFGPAAAGSPLFASTGVPGLTPDMFRPRQLQRLLRGQAGVQRFFTEAGRAFCLYAVVGSWADRGPLCARANQLVGTLRVGRAATVR
ncbi:MAG: hypothetical protein ACRDY0_00720 [Acidimicrobiales bacterium]